VVEEMHVELLNQSNILNKAFDVQESK
jgi:hypothetical protein